MNQNQPYSGYIPPSVPQPGYPNSDPGYPQQTCPQPPYPPQGPQPVYYPQPYPQPAYQPAPYYAPAFQIKPPRDPRRTQAEQKMNRLCLVALLQTAVSFVLTVPLTLLCSMLGADVFRDDLAYQLMSGALVPLSTTLPFLVYMKASRADTTEFLRFEKVGFFTGLLCVLAGLGVCLAGNFPAAAIQDFFSNFGYEPAQDTLGGGNDSLLLFLVELFTTAILVPVMEELAFRGVLCSALRKHGDLFAILGSSLVFAFAHLDFSTVVFAFIAGLTFGFLYCRTGNLWISILIHMLNNGIAVVSSYSNMLFGSWGDLFADLSMLVPLAVGLVALILLGVFCRTKLFARDRTPKPYPWPLSAQESLGSIARAPLFWVLAAMVVFYTASLII